MFGRRFRARFAIAGQAQAQHQSTLEILLGEGATLTASVLPDDTCAAWSKRPNEEPNKKESRCEEDSTFTLREARGWQAP